MENSESIGLIINKNPKKNSIQIILLYILWSLWRFRFNTWQFIVPLIFSHVFENSLFPFSIFQITNLIISFLFGSNVGNCVDIFNRCVSAILCLVLQIVTVPLIAFGLLILYKMEENNTNDVNYYWPFNGWWSFVLLMACTLVNSIYQLMVIGQTVVIRKDWIIVLSQEYNSNLETINSITNALDLLLSALSALIFSHLIKFSVVWAILILIAYNIISFFPELITLLIIYFKSKKLKEKKTSIEKEYNPIVILIKGAKVYIKQKVMFSSIAYVLLFFSVLTPDDIFLVYLKFCGISDTFVGYFKIAASIGFIASLTTPFLVKWCNLIRAGSFSYLLISSCLVFGVASYLTGYLYFGNIDALYILMVCVAVSRMGLWGVDLSQTQVMQVGVTKDQRGIVNSVELCLTNFVNMLMFVLSIVAANPHYFIIMVISSISCVLCSVIIFNFWGYSDYGVFTKEEDIKLRKSSNYKPINDNSNDTVNSINSNII